METGSLVLAESVLRQDALPVETVNTLCTGPNTTQISPDYYSKVIILYHHSVPTEASLLVSAVAACLGLQICRMRVHFILRRELKHHVLSIQSSQYLQKVILKKPELFLISSVYVEY